MKTLPEIRERVDLTPYNTLAIAASARYFARITHREQVGATLAWADEKNLPVLIVGGGSNLVFRTDIDGLVVHMALAGRHWRDISIEAATLVLGAGENWHDAVLYAARSGYRGIENLALIPGTCGAAPVQNIGAYGVELADTLVCATALDRSTGKQITLSAEACNFAYRDSLFKQQPERYLILDVHLRLSRSRPFQLGYGELAAYFGDTPVAKLNAEDVAEAVMAVRRRKLPDPQRLPNAGSFFKNPVVSQEVFEQLQSRFSDLVAYPLPHDQGVKLAAGWLIEQCGWKGYRNKWVGVHNRQALVLINHGDGSGEQLLALAQEIRESVQARFGVELEQEPLTQPAIH
ncbi:UDP-N-acetylmuramate dehydrogenase [Marinobacter sp. LV10R520-4]|uniref:UDP-N-acetylmuramate dehydrogenase n=1 Tax=Marinobacter sp. LV10R520-4 TaxID=1761796 RepID=UPI000BF55BDF|nr:UDP-N-acetylmuramate dehydrogenase [Marinobacter sp. LV10R520-4]PFG54944.1 UDP-N-acetylmuramate dehydrogenase [Marinobacter sp. LV10R520-4]